ncbi:MAG: 23S rRNA (uracil(1939)-C(5))-methyltransferase RlmD [Ignavibacteria bacterium]|nr:23S rRNA (uracil(1939)-C(5))-methyltransferase RlmD [Ignavibacteria bacterium]MBT8383564.1 23S rRNA (uracil(1939)-C(5))-methyltransferase RlmD [Ignavibacteria bacterium]NNJ52586.1 23S rRNA (uracil(1939)-C(5))-methyltransferase RlmD [Ignavibacteriaceae bacterium]NNL22567.1 23S rRNA (uracil(1939)-C(5))-methyltransferase RlmD [Ignavibacteriaceae bacterium]
MKKGDLVELRVEKYAFEGKGIATVNNQDSADGFVVFVKGAYPGDVVSAKIVKKKKSYAEAVVEEILSSSYYRVQPRCIFFGTCGGCRQQDLIYKQQINYKQQQVEEIFLHTANLSGFETEEILPSSKTFFYRNKMEFSFSDKRWLTKDGLNKEIKERKDFALGLHVPKVYDKILDINECFLQSELSNGIINFTRQFFKERKISIYSTKTHTGYLRNLVIRQAQNTDDLLVNLVTSEQNESLMKEFTANIINQFPQITSLVNNINEKKASVAVGDYEIVYYGSGFIYDKIGEYKFRISANSFFQTNTLQAENLYRIALEFAKLNGDEVVYDLYSGAGTIAIYFSEYAKEVYGFESVESSIFDAKENLEINNVKNVKFVQADLYKSFLPVVLEIPKPDIIILDPPRSGMHKNTVTDVLKLSPQKIVYVSCNPATQARDLKLMVDEGYKLIKIRPVDMFPHTYHIENIGLLIR